MTKEHPILFSPDLAQKLKVGDKVKFLEEKQRYTVQARSQNFAVLNKPFNARRTVLYTIIDWRNGIRGPENLVFGSGAETRKQCEEMIERLEGHDDTGLGATEVSHRNNIPVAIEGVYRNGRHIEFTKEAR